MPIDKSSPWGEIVSPPTTLPSFSDERDLSATLSGSGPRTLLLEGGDFVSLTGGQQDSTGKRRRYRCDVLEVRGLEQPRWTIGTVELRRRRSRFFGGFAVVTNLGVRNGERYSLRAHPNDAKFELIDALDGLTWRERMVLSKRFVSGDDLGHPLIKQRQESTYCPTDQFHVYVDGAYCGRAQVEIAIHPDFVEIYV